MKNKIDKSLNKLNIWNNKYNAFFNTTNIIENYNKEELNELDKVMLVLNEEDNNNLSKLYKGGESNGRLCKGCKKSKYKR